MIFILLLSHFIGDFPLQTDEIVKGKNNLEWKAYLKHFLHHFITSLILLILYYLISNVILNVESMSIKVAQSLSFMDIVVSILFIIVFSIIHILIDYLKVISFKSKYPLTKFGIDQLIHLTLIYYLSFEFYQKFFGLDDLLILQVKHFSVIATGLLISTYVISFIIDLIFEHLKVDSEEKKENNKNENNSSKIEETNTNASSVIGMIERLIIIGALVSGLELVVVAVIGFKTLISFNVDRKITAEYFIIGNLLSIGFAVLTYGLIEFLLNL